MSLQSSGLITHNVLIRKAYGNQLVLISCHYVTLYQNIMSPFLTKYAKCEIFNIDANS